MDIEINAWSTLFLNIKTNLILNVYPEKCIKFNQTVSRIRSWEIWNFARHLRLTYRIAPRDWRVSRRSCTSYLKQSDRNSREPAYKAFSQGFCASWLATNCVLWMLWNVQPWLACISFGCKSKNFENPNIFATRDWRTCPLGSGWKYQSALSIPMASFY